MGGGLEVVGSLGELWGGWEVDLCQDTSCLALLPFPPASYELSIRRRNVKSHYFKVGCSQMLERVERYSFSISTRNATCTFHICEPVAFSRLPYSPRPEVTAPYSSTFQQWHPRRRVVRRKISVSKASYASIRPHGKTSWKY